MSFSDRQGVLAAITEAFNNSGINYAVTHGLELFPEVLGRDLDLLIQAEQIELATSSLQRHFRANGWRSVVHRRGGGGRSCFAIPPGSASVIELDLVPRLRWGPTVLVEKPYPAISAHNLKVDPWAGFVKRILLPLLRSDLAKLQARSNELYLTQHDLAVIRPALTHYLGIANAATFLDAVEQRDFSRMRSLIPRFRRTLLLRCFAQRPDHLVSAVVDWARGKIAASSFGRPILPIVSVVGVDGVGKSSVIRELLTEISERLPVLGTQRRHWRPGLLPSLASLFGKTVQWDEAFPLPPRRHAGRGGFLRLLYYTVDFRLGGWWKDRRDAAQFKAVVYDRCALDVLVDPVRFGLHPSLAARLAGRLLPKPDFVFLLHDAPERIHQRKMELSIDEIERQQNAWLTLVDKGMVHHVITVQGSPRALAQVIADRLLDRFCK